MNIHLPVNRFIQTYCQVRDDCKGNPQTLITRLAFQFGISQIYLSDINSYIKGEFTCKIDNDPNRKKISSSRFNLLMIIHFIEIEKGTLTRNQVDRPRLYRMLDICFNEATLAQISVFHLLSMYVNNWETTSLAHHRR